jgi:hypothetical protein
MPAVETSRVLKLYFATDLGKNAVFSITPPASDVDEDDVSQCMIAMIDTPIFPFSLVTALGAEIEAKTKDVIYSPGGSA